MEILSSYNLIIEVSVIIILSFLFNSIAKKTNIPAVLMLIVLGVGLQFGLQYVNSDAIDFFPILEILGIVGLIMIVLEAALELELKREKLMPILKSFVVALLGLFLSAWIAALILYQFIPDMNMHSAWLYATPLSILSSAIIIPSVNELKSHKKEFHIYESTFSDIIGIMMFYFLAGKLNPAEDTGIVGFTSNLLLTIVISLIASYAIILIFQNIKSQVKLFLLIAVLLLLYAVGKKMHLSSLIIILIFGLVIANMKLFFKGKLSKLLDYKKAHHIYHELHTITAETAFVVRTFFFVIFGLTIAITSIFNINVAIISSLIIVSIYAIRAVLMLIFVGKDMLPQLFIAPRGLITVLLFYAIPEEAKVEGFDSGILLFVIIATSLIMTFAMIYDKRRSNAAINKANLNKVGSTKWVAPTIKEE
ncbi:MULTISPECIES: cation:proton antiporter domain-containing protein [Cellulophaga]|jgi:NhaP-type Na+/H+ or K+/H+ antiporter|uniref:Sodium/proton antiporter, CPA1 family n=1 Tax=Cellulophaga baltica TaxID=76594 RepID=A0A1G7LP02_9FLAO|nr:MULTISPECIES: cation:proton antiporter [Cellulophaga]WFO17180.1 cation:proton antiporter [Cellulophaga baltica 4]AIY14088.1 sodium:proton exchanger [Cellulophaga baltica NN016038]MCR1026688.1 cation:proton antiporter [Cellulophaga baltica]QXP55138.1 cation:proton antiporter [Cellulophaga sp. HaHa_2_95]SDF51121.1 sodium/proton antiporter, CPA1 family [Cellulophaga baltica]